MPPVRHRGRRTAPAPKVQSTAEREIRALQAERLEMLDALEDKLVELAKSISKHMSEGVATAEIASWLTSDDKPDGVSRQQVYKLVAGRVDGKVFPSTVKEKANATRKSAVPKPRPSRPVPSGDDRRGGPRPRPRPSRSP